MWFAFLAAFCNFVSFNLLSFSNSVAVASVTNISQNSEICLLFSRKQQKIFATCCWQYHIRNQRTRLPLYIPWNHISGTILKFVYLLFVNNNKYLSQLVHIIIFGISVPDYPSRTAENKSTRLFWNFCIFCLLYIHINNNKFTYDKFKSAKFGFSITISFSEVLLKLFTFLINTADKEI